MIKTPRPRVNPGVTLWIRVRFARKSIESFRAPASAHSERMARFLQCIVERTLAGRADELKEYLLGVEVFDHKHDYDPRVDPIVRVEARRLRSKLEDYYENHGAEAGVVIELPKGGYIPTIRPPGPTPTSDAPTERTRSVAVLPITSNGRDAEYEYLCEGITQEIIHALTKATDLRVVAWHSAARFSANEDVSSVGRQLGVCYVLRGTLRVSGGRLRLLAQLIDTATAEYVWSESYDRRLADVFDIEQDISDFHRQRVADADRRLPPADRESRGVRSLPQRPLSLEQANRRWLTPGR